MAIQGWNLQDPAASPTKGKRSSIDRYLASRRAGEEKNMRNHELPWKPSIRPIPAFAEDEPMWANPSGDGKH
ncbi:hypothetical protein Y1Q_0011897 [Alligator mississippiensis]|uniref:Uncharacterized protein n=1 Tax=Alligator mississippiensis TaxID=8496 RepID=A0A151NWP1_ALLMI|nr:hypothetical protein Y1Q_0011897 [Alligator mississippiensis]